MMSKTKARKLDVAFRQLEAARLNLVAALGEEYRTEHDESPLDGVDIAIHQLEVAMREEADES